MRVYLACPMTLYQPDHAYRRLLARVRRAFPNAEIVSPRETFSGTREWRERWPGLLPTLDAIAVAPDGDRIGLGVLREIADALFTGLPIYVLSPQENALEDIQAFSFHLDVASPPSSAVILTRQETGGKE